MIVSKKIVASLVSHHINYESTEYTIDEIPPGSTIQIVSCIFDNIYEHIEVQILNMDTNKYIIWRVPVSDYNNYLLKERNSKLQGVLDNEK